MWVFLKLICHCTILPLGAKINYNFCQWNSPLLKKGVTYSAIKIFNLLPSNILELRENKTLSSQHWESIDFHTLFSGKIFPT